MGARKYAKEVIAEGKRVRWPKKDVFVPALIATIVVCVLCALILSLEDGIAGQLINVLKQVFTGM